jgi:hypothetical protein
MRERPHRRSLPCNPRDQAGVDAGPVEAAEDARVLDLHAAVHHDVEARVACPLCRLVVDDAELHPQHLCADCDRRIGNRRDVARPSEAVDDIDGLGNRPHVGIALLPEHLVVTRIHRNDPIAVVLHVLRSEIARPVPLRRKADDGQRARAREDAAQAGDVVDDRHEARQRSQFGWPLYG